MGINLETSAFDIKNTKYERKEKDIIRKNDKKPLGSSVDRALSRVSVEQTIAGN